MSRHNQSRDIYLMMKANIWTVPGLCLYECSNYGSFPSTVDRASSASRQALSIPVPHFLHWDLAFLSVMRYQWGCRRHLGLPNYLPSPSSLSSHPTPLDSFCVSPSTTSVLSEHSTFFTIHSLLHLGFMSSALLILKSVQLIVHAVLGFLLLGLSYF